MEREALLVPIEQSPTARQAYDDISASFEVAPVSWVTMCWTSMCCTTVCNRAQQCSKNVKLILCGAAVTTLATTAFIYYVATSHTLTFDSSH